MDFASVLCTIFEQLLPINGGYLTTEANVEWSTATLTMERTTYQKLLKMLHRIPKTLAISTTN
jgi:hypothetical protein